MSNYPRHLDIVCEPDASVEVEVQSRPSGHVLYVHVNDITVARICRIQSRVRVMDNSSQGEEDA